MIAHVIRSVLEVCANERVIVITDDDEIDAIAQNEGVVVTREPETTGNATLDEVTLKVVKYIQELGATNDDIILTVQPTCPFIRAKRIEEATAAFADGAGSVITVVDDRHLGWRLDESGNPTPNYKARLNRQKLDPQFRETGAIIGCRIKDLIETKTRIVEPIRLIEVSTDEALDIDDFSDWAIAQYKVSRRDIIIRADASTQLGMGHVFRALAIAQELAQHRLTIAADRTYSLALEFLSNYPFEVLGVDGDKGFVELVQNRSPDLVILDQKSTSKSYVRTLKDAADKVVTFEDHGDGAVEADLLVSDLYTNLDVPLERQLTGISNAILAPSFETVGSSAIFSHKVENILVVFGGTDPSNLTEKTLESLSKIKYKGRCTVILGPGYQKHAELDYYGLQVEVHSNVKYMPRLMRSADLAISSAGRTISELTSLGIPVLCMCQNEHELTHTHASPRFGVVNLGLGKLVNTDTIAAHAEHLIESHELRETLRSRALFENQDRSNNAIIRRIEKKIGWS